MAKNLRHAAYLVFGGLLLAGCAVDRTKSSRLPDPPRRVGQTDNPLDLSVDGDGYFIVQVSETSYLFTRRGDFSVSSTGELVNEDGYRLFPVVTVDATAAQVAVTPDGNIRVRAADGDQYGIGHDVGHIKLARFATSAALDHDGVYVMPTAGSGEPITGSPGTNGLGTIVPDKLSD